MRNETPTTFYIFPGDNPLFHILFEDVRRCSHVVICKDLFSSNILLRLWYRIRRSRIVSLIGNLFKWCFVWNLVGIKSAHKDDILVFSNISVSNYPVSMLKRLKRKNIRIVLFFLDSISNNIWAKEAYNYTKYIDFDLVYSFDKGDAERNGFIHFFTPYSRLCTRKADNLIYDAFFVGGDMGRYQILSDIKMKFPNINIFVNMINITNEQREKAHFQRNTPMSYESIIDTIQASNCILDIVAYKDQKGLSLRPYEAVVYNKKLLTNNRSILDFPFYNPNFMAYFEDISDIDEDFLNDRVDVDYGYADEFSPVNFLKDIDRRLKQK